MDDSASKVARPNILVFLSDDHGQWASPPYGNSELVTPTLDYLAREPWWSAPRAVWKPYPM